jgi:UDP-N-acetylmuramoyl-L-alanyl-D-glutamate--2,6-diaminopimelate ligase
MKLSELLVEIGLERELEKDPEITGITHNSKWVQPGFIFVAIRGAKSDGHDFIPQALERGAVVIVGEGFDWTLQSPVPYLHVENARHALGDLSSAFYDHPSRELEVVGITGTDGKTTTAWMTHHLLKSAGIKTGLLSTVGYKLADDVLHHFPAHFTTPESPEVQRLLREMVDAGCEAAVLEVSSHALQLERVRGIQFGVGVFTNLTPEHLDFHHTMEEYFKTKATLFDHSNHFISNADNEWTARLDSDEFFSTRANKRANKRTKTRANWQAENIVQKPSGLEFNVTAFEESFSAQLPMIGDFNVQNTLAALAATHTILYTPGQYQSDSIEMLEVLIHNLSSFAGVPGRMQMVQHNKQSPRVVVDFAHTAPALEKALLALRPTTTGKLIVVIGAAGGNRDPQKRAPLGQIATQYADHAIFTEEDCRDTPIMDILLEMERGAKQNPHPSYELIPDRREAIWAALERATPQDTVLLAGKGPEETLERAGEVLPWNEVEVALELLGKITNTLEG